VIAPASAEDPSTSQSRCAPSWSKRSRSVRSSWSPSDCDDLQAGENRRVQVVNMATRDVAAKAPPAPEAESTDEPDADDSE